MNKVSVFLLILVIVLSVVLVAGVIYFYSETESLKETIGEQKARLENLGSQIVEKDAEISDLKSVLGEYEAGIEERAEYLSKYEQYIDEKIGVSFYYPKSWGEVTALEEPIADGEGVASRWLALSTRVPGEDPQYYIFLSSAAAEGDGRGGFWGDMAREIDGPDYINNFCQDKENCEVFTNESGITIAKQTNVEVPLNEATNATASVQYYIYNPNTIFHQMIISSANLEHTMTGLSDITGGLNEIANTLEFTE